MTIVSEIQGFVYLTIFFILYDEVPQYFCKIFGMYSYHSIRKLEEYSINSFNNETVGLIGTSLILIFEKCSQD